MSVEEYIRLEETSPVKHEYVAGVVYALAGPSKRHNRIAGNLYRALADAAEGGPCRVYVADVKLRPAEDVLYYPDVMVACGPEGEDPYVEEAPCLIVEVTSPSTATVDRREKLLVYREIPTVQSYLIVDQDEHHIVHHRRGEEGGWQVEEVRGGQLSISCPEVKIPVERIYRGVDLPE